MNIKTLELIDNTLRIIDQTRLPGELVYLDLTNYTDIIAAIKSLAVRGAPAIGIAAAYGIAIAAGENPQVDRAYMQRVGEEIKAARPTAVNLMWAIDRTLKALSDDSDIAKDARRIALAIHEEDRILCQKIGAIGAALINDGDTILTHCNAGALATGGIGTALGVIYTCQEQGKKVKVYADETRPLLQGARLTAWELGQAGIDVTLITDSTAGMLMQQGKIDHVIVGADRIAKNGDFANKIGTYPLAVLAKAHNVPFYVAAPYSTFDDAIESGDDIVIEERAAEEVTEGFGRRTAPDGVAVFSPAFDVTPHNLVTAYVTDRGVEHASMSSKIPKVVYKYRSWVNKNKNKPNYDRQILTDNVAYFASARKFNDPFDCAIPPRLDIATDEEYMSFCRERLPETNPEWDEARVDAEATELCESGIFKDDKRLAQVHDELQKDKYSKFGLFTVSEVKDNLLMWSHYSDSHKGFCVGLDSDVLRKHFKTLEENDKVLVEDPVEELCVEYYAEYPAWNTFEGDDKEWLFQQFRTKSADWGYEREWRYILMRKTDEPLVIPKEAIVEVILGCEMLEEHKTDIKNVLRENAIHAKLYQAVKSKSAFALEFDPVDY